MGSLIYQEVKQRKWLFAAAFFLFVIFYYAYGQKTEKMESLFMLFPLLATATIFGAEEEIEYIIVGRIPLWQVMVVRFVTIYLSVTALPTVFILCTRQSYVMMKILLTFWVTILLMCAVGLFWRIVLKSAFTSLLFSSLTYSLFSVLGWRLTKPEWLCVFVPFGAISISDEYFYLNRLVITLVTVLLLTVCGFALRKRQNV